MSTTTCSCCAGRRCVRVRSLDELSFDTALRRLRHKLDGEREPGTSLQQPPLGRTPDMPPRPWEMTRREFEAAAEPSIDLEPAWGTPRFRGLSRSVLRRELHFLLRCPGSPPEGYRVRVPARRADLYNQPHRAFVEAALVEGFTVPPSVLTEYAGLRAGRRLAAPPRLDLTPTAET